MGKSFIVALFVFFSGAASAETFWQIGGIWQQPTDGRSYSIPVPASYDPWGRVTPRFVHTFFVRIPNNQTGFCRLMELNHGYSNPATGAPLYTSVGTSWSTIRETRLTNTQASGVRAGWTVYDFSVNAGQGAPVSSLNIVFVPNYGGYPYTCQYEVAVNN